MTVDLKSDNNQTPNHSLQKVAKGASLVFIGSLIAWFFAFISRLIIARYWTESDYGIFSIAYSILSICTIISTLGLKQGVIRNIAYSRGKKDYKKILGLISSSIYFSVIMSLLVGLVLFIFSEIIAIELFHEPRLIVPLRIFSICVPFLSLIGIFSSIYRGFDQVKPTIYFQFILLNMFFSILLVLIIYFNRSFENIFYALTASTVVTFILFIIYATPRTSFKKILKIKLVKSVISVEAKELLFFSLPLLGAAVLNMVILWTDTLMLGGLKTSADVGLYNVAHPTAYLISFPLGSLLAIYIPVMSGLYAKRKFNEIKRNFLIITKWLCSATLPLFIFLFLFPAPLIELIFGSNYVLAANALRILSLGLIINNFVGPCGASLIAMGKSKFIMFATLIAATINIILNAILIPYYGIIGAAIASAVSLVSINIVIGWKLYSLSRVQPMSKNLIKPTIAFLMLIVPIYLAYQNYLTLSWQLLVVLFIVSYILYFLVFLITNSLDQEDIDLIQAIGEKTGKDVSRVKKFLSRFL